MYANLSTFLLVPLFLDYGALVLEYRIALYVDSRVVSHFAHRQTTAMTKRFRLYLLQLSSLKFINVQIPFPCCNKSTPRDEMFERSVACHYLFHERGPIFSSDKASWLFYSADVHHIGLFRKLSLTVYNLHPR